MNNLVQLDKNNHAFTTTLIIAEGVGVEHRAVRQLVTTYIEDFKDLSENSKTFEMSNLKGRNRPTTYYKLSELQATFLISLMKNSKIVVQFKKALAIQFHKMKKELARIVSNQTNAQWLEQRNSGKETRRIETDAIKVFIDYATAQGSKSAKMYYVNISKMENKALFIVEGKHPNIRDVLDTFDLSSIQKADKIVANALRDGMEESMPYKDIYKMARDRVLMYGDLLGKNPIGMLGKM